MRQIKGLGLRAWGARDTALHTAQKTANCTVDLGYNEHLLATGFVHYIRNVLITGVGIY